MRHASGQLREMPEIFLLTVSAKFFITGAQDFYNKIEYLYKHP